MTTPNEPTNSDIMAAITSLSSQITDIKNNLTEFQRHQEVKNLEVQNILAGHEKKLVQSFKRDIKSNLVVYNMEELAGEPVRIIREKVLDLLTNKLAITGVRPYDIHDIRMVGPKKNVLIVSLCSPHLVRIAMSQSIKLKGTKIAIDFDLSPEDRAEKRKLLAYRNELKDKGTDCKLRNKTLIINNVAYTLDQLTTQAHVSEASGSSSQVQATVNTVNNPTPTPEDREDYEMSEANKKRTPPEREDTTRSVKKFILNPPRVPSADTSKLIFPEGLNQPKIP